MFFWKKDKAKEILKIIQKIKIFIDQIKEFSSKKEKAIDLIKSILANIEDLKKEIVERADEEKSKSWIDVKFDSQIDNFSNKEIKEIEKLKEDLVIYLDLVEESKNENEINEVIKILNIESDKISEREKQNKNSIKKMESITMTERISNTISPTMSQNTKDGISWNNIAHVCRQLGGSVFESGEHQYYIAMPNSRRKIPLSADVNSFVIANEVIEQLRNSLPDYKIPKAKFLVNAFKKGNILKVA